MKKLFIACSMALLMACNDDPRLKLPQTGNYGTAVTEDATVLTADQVAAHAGSQVKVSGTVEEYCKGEGCWLTLKNPAGEPLFVEVANKAFVLPHNINGKTAVVEGKAIAETDSSGRSEMKVLATGILIK